MPTSLLRLLAVDSDLLEVPHGVRRAGDNVCEEGKVEELEEQAPNDHAEVSLPPIEEGR